MPDSVVRQARGIKRYFSMFEPVEELFAADDRRAAQQEDDIPE